MDGVRVVTRTVQKLKTVIKMKTRFRSRVRYVRGKVIRMTKFLRGKSRETKEALRRAKEEILRVAQSVWADAQRVYEELQSEVTFQDPTQSTMMSVAAVEGYRGELGHWMKLLRRVVEQMQTVLGGQVHIPNRLVSLFDEGARPIQKGKLFPKTEFGRKVLIQEAEKGLVTGYEIASGNPPDQGFLAGAVGQHEKIVGKVPVELAGDRGFYAPEQDEKLHEKGIEKVSIPVRGGKSAQRARTERSAWFRRLQRWRAGGEAKISLLKRKYGLRRTAVRGDRSTACWIAWGILAHNLVTLSRLSP
jgi:IS5 family transposase